MGRPRFCPAYNVERITETQLSETVQNFYVGSRIALVATGVNHAEFSEAAEKALSGIPKNGGNVVQEETKYYGGEHRELAPTGTNLVIAYGSEGRRTAGADFILAKVLGGGAQNKATPGSGASSRLYQGVVEKHAWVASARAYNVLHANQSLIGVQGYTPAYGHAEPLAAALETELKKLADQPISEEELGRAKALLKSNLDSYFATRKAIVSNLGSSVLAGSGAPATISSLAIFDSVSAKDVQSAAQRLLRQRPTVVVVGDATGLAPRS
jgi:predicted Zn-dependent peptidase